VARVRPREYPSRCSSHSGALHGRRTPRPIRLDTSIPNQLGDSTLRVASGRSRQYSAPGRSPTCRPWSTTGSVFDCIGRPGAPRTPGRGARARIPNHHTTLSALRYVSTLGPWSAYQATLGAKLRSEIRRRVRRLQEVGELSLDVADGSERLEDLLSEGFRVEQSGWKGAYGSAINSNSRTQPFYRDIARWASERGWLKLAFLRLDGRAITFDYCLDANRVPLLAQDRLRSRLPEVRSRNDPEIGDAGASFLWTDHRYEFLGTIVGANNRWKLDWTDRYHERMKLQAFPPTLHVND
jgi:hypothetical protein